MRMTKTTVSIDSGQTDRRCDIAGAIVVIEGARLPPGWSRMTRNLTGIFLLGQGAATNRFAAAQQCLPGFT